ncbi:hypothetical protein AAMO2058_000537400, partial [Amorphochlora amoebiformis]
TWKFRMSRRKTETKMRLPKASELTNSTKTGILKKWSSSKWGNNKKSQDRFCIIHGTHFYWFKSKKDPKPVNRLSLIADEFSISLEDNRLEFLGLAKSYAFEAQTPEQGKGWLDEIVRVRNAEKDRRETERALRGFSVGNATIR